MPVGANIAAAAAAVDGIVMVAAAEEVEAAPSAEDQLNTWAAVTAERHFL